MKRNSETMAVLPVIENGERREFCKHALATAGAFVCSGLIASLLQSCETDISKVSTAPTGDIFTINISDDADFTDLIDGKGIKKVIIQNGKKLNNGNPVIIIKISSTEFKVFTSVCTHEGKAIEPPDPSNAELPYEGKKLWCPTHDSYFDLDGKVIEGPAPTALREFSTSFDSTTKILTING